MNRDVERNEAAILEALESLDSPRKGQKEDRSGSANPSAQEYTELLALLPYALSPEHPSDALRGRLLNAVEGPGETTPAPLPFLSNPQKSALGRWFLPLAASLVVALLGTVFILLGQMREQQTTVTQLVEKLDDQWQQQVEVERLRRQLMDFQQRLDMITTVAAGLYPLRTPQTVAAQQGGMAPRGVLYVCANHQQWYLHLQNLAPTPEGYEYQLWFETEDGPVEIDSFEVSDQGEPVQMRNVSMPPSTHGVTVSLQLAGETPRRPTGPVVLQGNHSIKL